jgi:serine O-acetyltransferase
MDFYTRLVYLRKSAVFGKLAYWLLKLLGVEIPRSVVIGSNFQLEHGGFGVVIHSKTLIGNQVKVYPGVTVGRADIYRSIDKSRFEGVVLEDQTILCPGSRVLAKDGVLRVGRGTVVGANAVLLESTGEWEIWAGVPARRAGVRERDDSIYLKDIPTGDRE